MVPREKKNWPAFGPVERPDLPYAHFFYEKIFFRPALFFGRLERPKRPPNTPGLASVTAAVLWQHYFHRRPPTGPPARRSREARVHWCGSVHTAPRPAGGRVLCQGVLPGPVRPPTQRFSRLRGLYPALSPDEPAWGIPYLFPSRWFRVNKATVNWAVTILGGMKGLAPGQGPGCRAASEPPGQGAGVHFPGRQ